MKDMGMAKKYEVEKRYGITNDPSRRKRELEQIYDGFRRFRIEKRFPNQEEAREWERRQPNTCPVGPKVDGPFYGYSYGYKKKK